jgi:hypothetical protein
MIESILPEIEALGALPWWRGPLFFLASVVGHLIVIGDRDTMRRLPHQLFVVLAGIAFGAWTQGPWVRGGIVVLGVVVTTATGLLLLVELLFGLFLASPVGFAVRSIAWACLTWGAQHYLLR